MHGRTLRTATACLFRVAKNDRLTGQNDVTEPRACQLGHRPPHGIRGLALASLLLIADTQFSSNDGKLDQLFSSSQFSCCSTLAACLFTRFKNVVLRVAHVCNIGGLNLTLCLRIQCAVLWHTTTRQESKFLFHDVTLKEGSTTGACNSSLVGKITSDLSITAFKDYAQCVCVRSLSILSSIVQWPSAKPWRLFVVSNFIASVVSHRQKRKASSLGWLTTPGLISPSSEMVFSDSPDTDDSFDDVDLACELPPDLEEG